RAIEALLPELLELTQIIHVCGREGDETWLRAAAERLEPRLAARYKLFPYLETHHQLAGGSSQLANQNDELLPTANWKLQTMSAAFGAADLTICRSGASTMAELPAVGLPAVLVPYEGSRVHQHENADYLVQRGAAVKVLDGAMLGQGRPTEGPLFMHLRRLLQNRDERERMAEQSRKLAQPHAAEHLAGALLRLAAKE
ncbi:MAG: UDP-N-acetylglucosamine--N-acetylmuramyl-(pentapeptide) pyrophosphoryl-undecaprenol N-acetylglucosamine transferase, partial [Chloroflexaceae bacterium]|nr:UDP-N-acetylglucosamine--N-acetylmuramyl-(pentapeptide) pyrophosphoryl-undecaprenol N-acetylglucosamine transferase [Chloroflexaceae bacterium]